MSTLIPPLASGGRPLPTKVVVRLLPPLITEDDILKCVPEELVSEIDWKEFCQGIRPDRPSPENPVVNSRMYLNFKKFSIASDFITKMHGKTFIDDKGETFRAVVAFAPFQRVPRPWKQLKNIHEGKIELESHFQDFIASLGKAPEKPKAPAVVFTNERKEGYVSPLVAAIAKQNAILNEKIEARRSKSNGGPKKPPVPAAPKPPKQSEGKKKTVQAPTIIPAEGKRPPLAVCSFSSTEPKAKSGAPKRKGGGPKILKRSGD